MQEIKFRVWDKILNCWSKNTMGWYHNLLDGTISPEDGNRYIFEQYTGQKDKNNNEIYENDIVKCNPDKIKIKFTDQTEKYELPDTKSLINEIFIVEFDNDSTYGFLPFSDYDSDCGVYNNSEYFEKIGNIHENPELLKERT